MRNSFLKLIEIIDLQRTNKYGNYYRYRYKCLFMFIVFIGTVITVLSGLDITDSFLCFKKVSHAVLMLSALATLLHTPIAIDSNVYSIARTRCKPEQSNVNISLSPFKILKKVFEK